MRWIDGNSVVGPTTGASPPTAPFPSHSDTPYAKYRPLTGDHCTPPSLRVSKTTCVKSSTILDPSPMAFPKSRGSGDCPDGTELLGETKASAMCLEAGSTCEDGWCTTHTASVATMEALNATSTSKHVSICMAAAHLAESLGIHAIGSGSYAQSAFFLDGDGQCGKGTHIASIPCQAAADAFELAFFDAPTKEGQLNCVLTPSGSVRPLAWASMPHTSRVQVRKYDHVAISVSVTSTPSLLAYAREKLTNQNTALAESVAAASGATSLEYEVGEIPHFRSNEVDYPWMSSRKMAWAAEMPANRRELYSNATDVLLRYEDRFSNKGDWSLHLWVFASGGATRALGSGSFCGAEGKGFGVFLLPRRGRSVVRFVWAWPNKGVGLVDFEPHSLGTGAWEFINITHNIGEGFRLWSGRLGQVAALVKPPEVKALDCNEPTITSLPPPGSSTLPVAILFPDERISLDSSPPEEGILVARQLYNPRSDRGQPHGGEPKHGLSRQPPQPGPSAQRSMYAHGFQPLCLVGGEH